MLARHCGAYFDGIVCPTCAEYVPPLAPALMPEGPDERYAPMILDSLNPKKQQARDITIHSGVPWGEWSKQFIEGMLNRMTFSFHKYGKIKDAYPDKVDAIESLKVRLSRYEDDGNTEWLMDVANFAMIEFMHPAHPAAHFAPQDSDTSPGRRGRGGGESAAPNDSRVWG